ncbi:MAG: alpha/beta fold hydrolase [Saccharofermentanales bacterium]
MKLVSRKLLIDDIPVIEITPRKLQDQCVPLIVFYHGWTSNKVNGADFGEIIAKFGFRVVVPDCAYHGERNANPLKMWDTHFLFLSIMETAAEFKKIINYYQMKDLIINDFYCAAGVSMGGLITNILIRKYPGIKAAGIFMASPQLQKFAEWISFVGLEDMFRAAQEFYPGIALPDERLQLGIINKESDLILELLPELENFDLSLQPESIAGRPVFYWHAQPDPMMPYELTAEFYENIKDLPEAKYVYFKGDTEGSHFVPLLETRRLALFLKNSYQALALPNSQIAKKDIWQLTNKQIIKFMR